MNALRSMMKATARVRRDGRVREIPAEEVVVGDVVLLSAGDQVPADGRLVEAVALQIDESALTGESTPADKEARILDGRDLGPGDQTSMAFMHTPVTHGSGLMLVTGTGSATQLGRISAMLSATEREKSPLTKELDRLTLWIAGAAGVTVVVMFLLGRSRGEAWDVLFISAVALAIAAIPEALPTVHHAAILPYVVANDARLVDGRVVGDPTEGALLVLGHKAGLDVDATRERLPRLATLPFDPTHKLMATFHSATAADGRPVARCFVKRAGPAVMARAATATPPTGRVAWDAELKHRMTRTWSAWSRRADA